MCRINDYSSISNLIKLIKLYVNSNKHLREKYQFNLFILEKVNLLNPFKLQECYFC